MLGCVQKDLGKPHHRLVCHDVSDVELHAARQLYSDVFGDYKAGKIVISKAGLADRIIAFWHANYKPFLVPMDVVLLHMIASGKYVPCGTCVTATQGQRVDYEVSSSWIMMIMRPEAVTLEQIRIVFWGEHARTCWRDTRYHRPTVPDFQSTLTKLQVNVLNLWYEHACEVEVMPQVVADLRAIVADSI